MQEVQSVRFYSLVEFFVALSKWFTTNWTSGRWKHDEVPSEIAAGLPPKPDGWGLPAAMLLSDASCPTQSLIRDQSIVVRSSLDIVAFASEGHHSNYSVLYVDRHHVMWRMVQRYLH